MNRQQRSRGPKRKVSQLTAQAQGTPAKKSGLWDKFTSFMQGGESGRSRLQRSPSARRKATKSRLEAHYDKLSRTPKTKKSAGKAKPRSYVDPTKPRTKTTKTTKTTTTKPTTRTGTKPTVSRGVGKPKAKVTGSSKKVADGMTIAQIKSKYDAMRKSDPKKAVEWGKKLNQKMFGKAPATKTTTTTTKTTTTKPAVKTPTAKKPEPRKAINKDSLAQMQKYTAKPKKRVV